MPTPSEFPAHAAAVALTGPAGTIETLTDQPAAGHALRGTAIVCHPHPQHGGTMHNKVVTMIARALRESGLRTVRFNFRGVGASDGQFDEGNGETEDLLAVAAWVKQVRPDDALWLAGFSFGSYVALRAARHLTPAQMISVAPPVDRFSVDAVQLPHCPWLVVQGEDDDVVSPQAVYRWLAELPEAPTLIKMPETGHFFHRKLMDLRGLLKNALRSNLPVPDPDSRRADGPAARAPVADSEGE